jgi:hypothetical protein
VKEYEPNRIEASTAQARREIINRIGLASTEPKPIWKERGREQNVKPLGAKHSPESRRKKEGREIAEEGKKRQQQQQAESSSK